MKHRHIPLWAALALLPLLACAHYGAKEQVLDYMSLSYAANGANLGMARLLLERGAPTEPINPMAHPLAAMAVNFSPPIQSAAERGDVAMVQLLLEHGADPNIQCCSSDTALGYAAAAGHVEVVRLLLAYGADPRLSGVRGSPLELAREADHEEIVGLLSEALNAVAE